MSRVGFSRQIRAEVADAASQITFDNFVKVYKKIQERISKVLLPVPSLLQWKLMMSALFMRDALQIFLLSLASTEFMELTNTFVVLRVRSMPCLPQSSCLHSAVRCAFVRSVCCQCSQSCKATRRPLLPR